MIDAPKPPLVPGAADSEGWIKARDSDSGGNCVQVKFVGDEVWFRNSRDPDGPALKYTRAEWLSFRRGMLDGDFDKQHDGWVSADSHGASAGAQ